MQSASNASPRNKLVTVESDSLYLFYVIRIAFFIPAVVVTWYHFSRKVEVEYIAYFLIFPIALSLALSDFRLDLSETTLMVFKQNFYGRLFTQYTTFDRKEVQDITTDNQYPSIHPAVEEIRIALELPPKEREQAGE